MGRDKVGGGDEERSDSEVWPEEESSSAGSASGAVGSVSPPAPRGEPGAGDRTRRLRRVASPVLADRIRRRRVASVACCSPRFRLGPALAR